MKTAVRVSGSDRCPQNLSADMTNGQMQRLPLRMQYRDIIFVFFVQSSCDREDTEVRAALNIHPRSDAHVFVPRSLAPAKYHAERVRVRRRYFFAFLLRSAAYLVATACAASMPPCDFHNIAFVDPLPPPQILNSHWERLASHCTQASPSAALPFFFGAGLAEEAAGLFIVSRPSTAPSTILIASYPLIA